MHSANYTVQRGLNDERTLQGRNPWTDIRFLRTAGENQAGPKSKPEEQSPALMMEGKPVYDIGL